VNVKRLKSKLGKWLIGVGLWLHDDDVDAKPTEVKQALGESLDAAVEVPDGLTPQWSPEQHGNVVMAEPELMILERRGKL
jgi:hypothetical protein